MNDCSPINTTDTPVQFKANHPFVFIILDKDTGVICFMGVFADPSQILEVVQEKDLKKEEIHQLLTENDANDLESFGQCSGSASSNDWNF